MENIKREIIKECINNRKYLGLSCKDMSNCLINVSEKDYVEFEQGNYPMNKENVQRIIKVLCISKPNKKDYSEYIDTTGLNKEEIEDLCSVLEVIVGDDDA